MEEGGEDGAVGAVTPSLLGFLQLIYIYDIPGVLSTGTENNILTTNRPF